MRRNKRLPLPEPRFILLVLVVYVVHYVTSNGIPIPCRNEGSLARCGRACSRTPECTTFVYWADNPDYDCCLRTDDEKDNEGKDEIRVNKLPFSMVKNFDDEIKVNCTSYIEVGDQRKTISVPEEEACFFVIAARDKGQMLMMQTTIQCNGCNTGDFVSIYNVRDDVIDPISAGNQSEGSVVCQNASSNQIQRNTFLAANETYFLVFVGRPTRSDFKVTFNITQENWTSPRPCSSCTDLRQPLPNACTSTSTNAVFHLFISFHDLVIAKSTTIRHPLSSISTPRSTSSSTTKQLAPSFSSTTSISSVSSSKTTAVKTLTLTLSPTSSTINSLPTKLKVPTSLSTSSASSTVNITTLKTSPTTFSPSISQSNHNRNISNTNSPEEKKNSSSTKMTRAPIKTTSNGVKDKVTTTSTERPDDNGDNKNNDGGENNETNGDQIKSVKTGAGVLPAGTIAGSVIGSAVGIAGMAAAIVGLYRRQQRMNKVVPRKEPSVLFNAEEGESEQVESTISCIHGNDGSVVKQELPLDTVKP